MVDCLYAIDSFRRALHVLLIAMLPVPHTIMIMRVWIDQDLCTGDGICVEICPKLFAMSDDGLAYVKESSWPNLLGPSGTGPGPALSGADGTAAVPEDLLDDAIEAAEACPGECIFFDA